MTVAPGDTLQSIAKTVYGDSALWYLIADANGLSGNADLTVGQALRIPSRVGTASNNANAFTPYDPSKVIGDTSPNLPNPPAPSGGCGGLGQILVMVISAVITAALFAYTGNAYAAAAAGSIFSQAFGMAIGVQKEPNFGAVALAIVSAGIGEKLGGVDFAGTGSLKDLPNTMIRAAVANTATQGIGLVTGLQKEFNWGSVAFSAASAGVSWGVNNALGITDGAGQPTSKYNGYDPVGKMGANFLSGFITGTVMNTFSGGKMTSAQIATDAFGNALGNSIADTIKERQQEEAWLKAQLSLSAGQGRGLSAGERAVQAFVQASDEGIARAASELPGVPSNAAAAFVDSDSLPLEPVKVGYAAVDDDNFGLVTDNSGRPDRNVFYHKTPKALTGQSDVRSAITLNRVPQGIMSQEGIDAANENMQQLLQRGDLDMVDLIAGTQTPGMMKRWVVENKEVFATRFSGALSVDELAYMGQQNFPVQNILSPTSLTKDQAAEARNLYGDDAHGSERYANYRNRAVMLNYMTSSVVMHALGDTWDFVRDLNPVLFAYERAYRIKTGEDAWTGAPENPLTAAAELAVGLFGAKAGRSMIGKLAQGMESLAPSSGLMTSLNPYAKSEINAALKGSGLNKHHINESAAYKSGIEPSYGLTVPLEGWGTGTAHTNFHDAMNVFWKPYQKNGELFGTRPTNAQVGQAQTGAFLNAGFTVGEAKYLSAAARAERYYYGLKDAAYVPRVPKT